MSKQKIMLVDDSALVLDVVGETLRRAGYEVIARSVPVGTGAAILRERPIVALLDVSMPLMSGTEISEAIRGSSVSRSTWVLLHSDCAEPELQEHVRRCGADGYIRKTGNARQLLDAVAAWVARGRPSSNAGYILVACNADTRERLSRELDATLPVRYTESGAEALRQACSREAPAILLMGTTIADVPPEVVLRSAERNDPSWRQRFVVLDEREAGVRPSGSLGTLPSWSVHDPVGLLAATLGALGSRN